MSTKGYWRNQAWDWPPNYAPELTRYFEESEPHILGSKVVIDNCQILYKQKSWGALESVSINSK